MENKQVQEVTNRGILPFDDTVRLLKLMLVTVHVTTMCLLAVLAIYLSIVGHFSSSLLPACGGRGIYRQPCLSMEGFTRESSSPAVM